MPVTIDCGTACGSNEPVIRVSAQCFTCEDEDTPVTIPDEADTPDEPDTDDGGPVDGGGDGGPVDGGDDSGEGTDPELAPFTTQFNGNDSGQLTPTLEAVGVEFNNTGRDPLPAMEIIITFPETVGFDTFAASGNQDGTDWDPETREYTLTFPAGLERGFYNFRANSRNNPPAGSTADVTVVARAIGTTTPTATDTWTVTFGAV